MLTSQMSFDFESFLRDVKDPQTMVLNVPDDLLEYTRSHRPEYAGFVAEFLKGHKNTGFGV